MTYFNIYTSNDYTENRNLKDNNKFMCFSQTQ